MRAGWNPGDGVGMGRRGRGKLPVPNAAPPRPHARPWGAGGAARSFGAHAQGWVRRVARALHNLGVRTLIDANARNVRLAVRDGLPAKRANVLAEGVIDEIELSGIGRLLAVTPNDEVNSLAALYFGEVFESDEVFQIPVRTDGAQSASSEIPRHLRGRPLFSTDATYTSLDERFDNGAEVRVLRLDGEGGAGWLREAAADETFTPLSLVRGEKVRVYAEDADITPQPNDALVALVDPDPGSEALWRDALEEAARRTADADRAPSNEAAPPRPVGDGLPGPPADPPRATPR